MKIRLNLSRKYKILLSIAGFVFLSAAIATPFFLFSSDKKQATASKKNHKTHKIVVKNKGYDKIFPWNNSTPQGEYYFTTLNCSAKKIAKAENPHVIQVTFYGKNYSNGFTTKLKFKGKEASFTLKSIGGFSAKRISNTGLGALLVESKEDGINCYTSIAKNDSRNSQDFFDYDILSSATYFDCRSVNIDDISNGSAALHIQNLRNSEALIKLSKNEKIELPLPVNKIPPLGSVSIPLQIERGTIYSLNYFSWENDIEDFVPVDNLSNGFIAYIEYQSNKDKNDKSVGRNNLLRRYIRSSSKHTLPFNTKNGYVTNLACESPSKETVRIDFKGGNKKNFTTEFSIKKKTTSGLKSIAGITKNIGNTTGIIEMYLPLATSCKTVIQRGQMSAKVIFSNNDYFNPVPIFDLNNYSGNGNLFVYNRSLNPITFNILKYAVDGGVIDTKRGIKIEGYDYLVTPITEKDVSWLGLYAQCSPGFPPNRQTMNTIAFVQYKKKRGTIGPIQSINPSEIPRTVIKGDCDAN